MKILIGIALFLLLNGCSSKSVKPWEKGTLAKKTMQFGGIYPEIVKYEGHIYYSKEASRGGAGVGGGGCGCN